MSTNKLIILCLGVLMLGGCQTIPYQGQARDVKKRREQGGVLALPINQRPEDQQVAQAKMRDNCGTLQVKVIEEGEVIVGTKSVQNARTANREDTRHSAGEIMGIKLVSGEAAGADTRTESSTEAIKEWQITYECAPNEKPSFEKPMNVKPLKK